MITPSHRYALLFAAAPFLVTSTIFAEEPSSTVQSSASEEPLGDASEDGATDESSGQTESSETSETNEEAGSEDTEESSPPKDEGTDEDLATETSAVEGLVGEEDVAPSDALDQRDSDAVFRAFSTYAEDQRRRRVAKAIGGLVIGGATMGFGAVLDGTIDADPKPWYITGGLVMGLSAIQFFMRDSAEQMAAQYYADQPGHSAEDAALFESKWAEETEKARSRRLLGGGFSLLLGAGVTGTGIAIAAGAGDMSNNDRGTWGSILIGSGAGLLAAGIANFIVKSPIESSYDEYVATSGQSEDKAKSAQISLGLHGLGMGMRGSF